ncbi:MAG TPA: hypothetical protein VHE35_00385 [Kofleriaceae bacterium]|nr:hypothetical protein [Kofleriaceae bacterium]
MPTRASTSLSPVGGNLARSAFRTGGSRHKAWKNASPPGLGYQPAISDHEHALSRDEASSGGSLRASSHARTAGPRSGCAAQTAEMILARVIASDEALLGREVLEHWRSCSMVRVSG